MQNKVIYRKIFSIFGFLGVALGAFGAHALKSQLTGENKEIWHTATLYLFIHAIAGLLATESKQKNQSSACFALGCTLFSGSLYLLVLLKAPILGLITPLGGLSLLCGWFFFFWDEPIKRIF